MGSAFTRPARLTGAGGAHTFSHMKLSKSLGIVALSIFVGITGCAGVSADISSRIVEENVGSEQATFDVVELVAGISRPWALAFLPDGDFLVTIRSGRLLRINGDSINEVRGLPEIATTGQGGLLDIILDPDFESTNRIYFSHAVSGAAGTGTAISRATLSGTRLSNLEEIFRMDRLTFSGRHFGSRLGFMEDGTLLFTIGDRGERDRAQDLGDHAGSTLRINPDGSIPADNPFVDEANALDAIYSYGHRNAQGMAIDPATGRIWQHEHGPQGGDELNLVQPAENYGWPEVTYGREYGTGFPIGEDTAPTVPDPLTYWTPSIAPSGLTLYRGEQFPEWDGDLFVGALAGRHLRRVELDGAQVVGEEVLLDGTLGRIRDVRTGPDGFLYLLTDEDNGGLYRLEPVD